MFAQQPTVAAPAAMPFRPRIIPSAAELIGRVRIIPINTDTTIPIRKGACTVPQLIRPPSQIMNAEMGGPRINPTAEPDTMQAKGVTKISTFVLPDTRRPT